VLWQQRLSTLQGATAALDVERLKHDKVLAQRAAQEDPLTGLGNRCALGRQLRDIELLSRHDDRPTSLLVVDLDRFKEVNDAHGHTVGDDVLRAVADAIRGVARSEDLVARLGGDEFVVLAHGTDADAGRGLAGRIRDAVEQLVIDVPSGRIRLTASVGVSTTDLDTTLTDLFETADLAMYEGKRKAASAPVTPPRPPE
jgi:diguanylate cyclase (GGDEF)-like protein